MSRDIAKLEDDFSKAQQVLVERFKLRLGEVAKEVIGNFYTDVTNYATTDAHTNYHNLLREEFEQSLTREITEEYGHYSWAHRIRVTLLEMYPHILRNKIISDLQEKVKSLEDQNEQLRRYR